MFKFLRGTKATKTETILAPVKSTQQILQETFVEEQRQINSERAVSEIVSYQRQRQAKLNFIEEAVIANGYDMEDFLQILVKEKPGAASVDDFSLDEIKQAIQKEMVSQSEFGRNKPHEEHKDVRPRNHFTTQINRDISDLMAKDEVVTSTAAKRTTLQV